MIFAVCDGTYGEELIAGGDTVEEAYQKLEEMDNEVNLLKVVFYTAKMLNVKITLAPTFTVL